MSSNPYVTLECEFIEEKDLRAKNGYQIRSPMGSNGKKCCMNVPG
jgi:hypothetical protein